MGEVIYEIGNALIILGAFIALVSLIRLIVAVLRYLAIKLSPIFRKFCQIVRQIRA
jgi:hypothetical protein